MHAAARPHTHTHTALQNWFVFPFLSYWLAEKEEPQCSCLRDLWASPGQPHPTGRCICITHFHMFTCTWTLPHHKQNTFIKPISLILKHLQCPVTDYHTFTVFRVSFKNIATLRNIKKIYKTNNIQKKNIKNNYWLIIIEFNNIIRAFLWKSTERFRSALKISL